MQERQDQNVPPLFLRASKRQQNPGQQSSAAPKKDDLEENHQDNDNQKDPNSTEIVRSIASYLSLSDVESIGSLYSLVSPQAQAQGYSAYRGTPKLWRSVSNSSHHGTTSGSNLLPSSNHNEMMSGNSSLFSRHRFSSLASIDDNMMDYTDSSEGGNHSARGSSSKSGPDAAAGIGTHEGQHVTSAWGRNMVFDENDMSETPGLVAMSPVPLDDNDEISTSSSSMCHDLSKKTASCAQHEMLEDDSRDDGEERQHLIRIQEGLKNAVFEAPQSIRSYCLQSHKEAAKIRLLRRKEVSQSHLLRTSQESAICPLCHQSNSPEVIYFEGVNTNSETNSINHICGYQVDESPQQNPLAHILSILTSSIFQNVPLSILFDVGYQTMGTSLKVVHASLSITVTSTEAILHILVNVIHQVLEGISHNLNPMSLLNNIMQLQRKAMGKTSESILTGIHSVATGVGSARTAAMHAFSKPDPLNQGLGMNNSGSPRSGMVSVGTSLVGDLLRRGNTRETVMSEKMFQKLNKVSPASKVVKYIERDDEVLTKHAKKRIQRIMHYSVPLRPFVATVETVPFKRVTCKILSESDRRDTSFGTSECSSILGSALPFSRQGSELLLDDRLGRGSPAESPFMSTPKSFPPTPSSRAHVLARGTRFAEDVVFLARDQLRVEKGMDSDNAQTRAMAKALSKGKRLAVFNASDVGAGIQLSCGQHCASKIGNDLYSTARSMIPVLRNSFVYFEMTVSTPPLLSMMLHHASLSVGLSTLEMPLNALVGAWKGSVGLCSTGQMLAGSQWCSPMNPKTYGSKSTVGCLIYLDDDSAFETWDGVMVTANVVFNVDGQVIIPANTVGSMPSGNEENATNPSEEGQYSTVIPIFVPREEEIFPTLTLHSSQTEVLCRFCAEDILATSRSIIGAPRGVTVYAIDGSVLFDEDLPDDNDDVSFSDDEYTDLDHTFSSYEA